MPPHATGIDAAPELDTDLRVQYDAAGEPRMRPVGSRSIKQLIQERQPTLALHGHIHEGRGRYKLGDTVGVNPGSQYQDGVLLGVLIRISAARGVQDLAFTAG
jgi:Icc-related predicted phosphoesterase